MLISLKRRKKILSQFEARSESGDFVTNQEIKRHFESRIGHSVNKGTIARLLKRNDWRKAVPRPKNPKSTTEEQEAFKKEFPILVEQALEDRSQSDHRPVIVMAQDEGRFGRINDPRRCWSPKWIRPVVPKQIVRQFLYVFAAICPLLGKMTALLLPYANTEMMQLLLNQVEEDFKGYFIVMLIDRASWHTSSQLQIPENIRLIPQPPGSPELNPTEHLWEDLRENEMANRHFENLDQVETALCLGINRLAQQPKKISSMTNFDYLNLSTLNST